MLGTLLPRLDWHERENSNARFGTTETYGRRIAWRNIHCTWSWTIPMLNTPSRPTISDFRTNESSVVDALYKTPCDILYVFLLRLFTLWKCALKMWRPLKISGLFQAVDLITRCKSRPISWNKHTAVDNFCYVSGSVLKSAEDGTVTCNIIERRGIHGINYTVRA